MAELSYEDGCLKIDLQFLIERMSTEDKKTVLKSLAVQEDVTQWVLDYICDKDSDGWWSGGSDEVRVNFLQEVEQTELGRTWLSCYWSPWSECRDALKMVESHREVSKRLERLMRDYDNPMSEWLRKHFDVDECSHYVTKLADEKIKEIENIILKTLAGMKKK